MQEFINERLNNIGTSLLKTGLIEINTDASRMARVSDRNFNMVNYYKYRKLKDELKKSEGGTTS